MDKDSSSTATIAVLPVMRRTISDSVAQWAKKERHISRETLGKMPVASGTVKRSDAIYFQYKSGWKARSTSEKYFTQKPKTEAEFWNLEAVLAGPRKEVFIVEGEMDALALVEVGIPPECVLAAPSATVGELGYVKDALKAGLKDFKRYVWCGDSDDPGIELRAMMVNILGSAKMHHVEWPEGIKDANAFLVKDGADALYDRLRNGSVLWPVNGLYDIDQIPDTGPTTLWDSGFIGWGNKLRLAPGMLSIATGHPGHGKTILWAQIWHQVIRAHDLVACIASFETRPNPYMRRILRQLIAHKNENAMDESERASADKWIKQHYKFAVHEKRAPNLLWMLDMAEVAVVRHGARVVVIDPWNRLEAGREPRESETDYIGRCLREVYNFAVDFNCHVQIIAHPAKMEHMRRGTPPELEDIAGSKHWDNMPDQGFVIHRPQLFDETGQRQFYAELHHKKARFDGLGFATKFGLNYDPDAGRFVPCELQSKKKRKNEDSYE